ncbi:MAG TPA: AfsR/SARP family transcriptional regulator [Gaiellaceae bacterium]|jgi:DNA-binding SARP family transcriptional activator
MIEFGLLGPLSVRTERGDVRLGGARQRSTLAILLLNAGQVVSVERLADDLYSGDAPATAVAQVQRQISDLRKALGAEARVETSPPGYVLRLDAHELDITRFERLLAQGTEALNRGDAASARSIFEEALALWRGRPLADLAGFGFAQAAAGRLEELRLVAVERRLQAELALGRHAEVVPTLEELTAEEPLREGLTGLLMLALYRSGRQADALAAYRALRTRLSTELGLEPAPELRSLETAILRQDTTLAAASLVEAESIVLAATREETASPALLALARMRDTIVVRIERDEAALTHAAAALEEQRRTLGATARAAAFVSADWALDLVRTARTHDASLVLVDARVDELTAAVGLAVVALVDGSPADVGLLIRGDQGLAGPDVYVPFGGGEHDWAALEVAAALAAVNGFSLKLVGTASAPHLGRRDASRLLADAALAVQRAIGVSSTPILTPAVPDAVVAVVEPATIVVAGFASRWRTDGLGPMRAALAVDARPPVLFVHRGPSPGLLSPRETRTRFTWTLQN